MCFPPPFPNDLLCGGEILGVGENFVEADDVLLAPDLLLLYVGAQSGNI